MMLLNSGLVSAPGMGQGLIGPVHAVLWYRRVVASNHEHTFLTTRNVIEKAIWSSEQRNKGISVRVVTKEIPVGPRALAP